MANFLLHLVAVNQFISNKTHIKRENAKLYKTMNMSYMINIISLSYHVTNAALCVSKSGNT